MDGVTRRTAQHRIFSVFRPVRHRGPAPLLVVYNGGPGMASNLLLTSGPLSLRVDFTATTEPTLEQNSHPWIDFASILVVDAPDAGFSYRVVADPATAAPLDFDPDADASIVLRAVLGFLADHPDYVPERLGFVGESYGGVRTTLILDRVLGHTAIADQALGEMYFDSPLGAEVDEYLSRVWPESGPASLPSEEVGKHLLQVHVQSVVLGSEQQSCDCLAALPPLQGCIPDGETNQCDMPEEEYRTQMGLKDAAIVAPPLFEQLLDVPVTAVRGLAASERAGAWRGGLVDTTALASLLGELPWTDAYFLPQSMTEAAGLRDSRGDVRGEGGIVRALHESFLHNVWHVPAFFTNAGRDALVRTDALVPILDAMDGLSAWRDDSPRPGVARPGWISLCSEGETPRCRELRLAPYPDAGHAVTIRAHAEFAEDLAAWIDEARAEPTGPG